MAQSRFGFPTPPPPGEDHRLCPVCGWSPCTATCRLGLCGWELADLSGRFDDPQLGPAFGSEEGDPFLPPSDDFLPPAAGDYVDEGDFEP